MAFFARREPTVPSLIPLLLPIAALAMACGGAPRSAPQSAYTHSTSSSAHGFAPSGLPAVPPSWAAALASNGGSLAGLLQTLPCPAPGLPPEVARMVDCSAVRKIAGAAHYVPAKVVEGALPANVDLRVTGLTGPVKNQEQVGACAGFALSTVMDNSARRLGRGDTVAPLHVFSTYGNHRGLEAVRGVGMTLEPTWPYDPRRACEFADDWTGQGCGEYYGVKEGGASSNPALLGEKARADASARYRVDAFEEMDPVDPAQLALLVAGGEAVWISMQFDYDAWSRRAVSDGVLHDFNPTFPVGHAVVVSGYRRGASEREFLLQNSWGPSWGDHGSAWIGESTLKRRANYAYRLRVSDAAGPGLGGPAQIPQLPSNPWPGLPSCAQGSLATPFGCVDPRSLPGAPGGFTVPAVASCPAGSFPNPLTGGCAHL